MIQFQIGKSMTSNLVSEKEEFEGDPLNINSPTIENFLLLGTDQVDVSGKARTDTMMVLSLNKEENEIRVISLMRDIYADIPGYQSYKLNTAYFLGGIQTAKDTVTHMFGIPIHHYAIVDFENFETIIDLAFPKGVEINVQKDMSENIGVVLTQGVNRLNGEELLGYARFRADAEGDFGRVERQQEILAAIKNEGTQLTTVLKYPKVMGALSNLIDTDLSQKDQIVRLLPFLFGGDTDLQTMTIPVEHSFVFKFYEHAGSVIEIDIEQNRQAIHQFLSSTP